MELEVIQNEFQRLSVDKQKVDETITKAELDLIRLKQNRDMLVGAMQTCSFLISQEEPEEPSEPEVSEKSNKK